MIAEIYTTTVEALASMRMCFVGLFGVSSITAHCFGIPIVRLWFINCLCITIVCELAGIGIRLTGFSLRLHASEDCLPVLI